MAGDNEIRRITADDIDIHIEHMDVFNCAMYQNGLPPIRGIQIINHTQDPIEGLTMMIKPETDIIGSVQMALPVILPGKPTRISDPDFSVNGKILAELTESINVNVRIVMAQYGEPIFRTHEEIRILTYDQWMGEKFSDYLPSFVMPNHPVVSGLLHDAAMIMNQWKKENPDVDLFNPAIDGYQSGNPNRTRILAAAAYVAIQKKNIVYATAKANLWEEGQRIRTPEIIMQQRLGNCMDMTLLYAACLEAMGLHALLYAIEGHIFAGLWLHETGHLEAMKLRRQESNEEILKRSKKGSEEIIFIECTAMCAGQSIPFDSAEIGERDQRMDSETFDFVIDLNIARCMNIRPLFSRTMKDGHYEIDIQDRKKDEITQAPEIREIDIQTNLDTGKRIITSKKELWETKLLDLSTHNMLLSLPGKNVEPIMSSYVDEIEDALADGEEFKLCPLPKEVVLSTVGMKDSNSGKEKEIPLIAYFLARSGGAFELTDWQIGDVDFASKWRQEARSHRLYTYRTQDELEKNLTALYRAATASQQENGVSSLYMAVGLLRWIEETEEGFIPHHAPLILVPIEIVRKSANQGFGLHMRDEEPHFNLTLLEMLKQQYNMDIGGLDPLPGDEHGVDIKRAFAIVRRHLQTVKDWDVIETCVIGNFSFAQFAMWNDIHRAGEMLEQSDIVRSLVKGHVDWDVSQTETEEDGKTYLPITVDGTQLEAIHMAEAGKTFVLHGPPGTGKSQTITAMIANLMAHGKRVLFVAEKMAALSVVDKRLTSLGIGDFCLELHSDKANKKHVLTQLDRALSRQGKRKTDEYAEYLQKYNASRDALDQYMQHLHETRKCGYSMFELIDLYETTTAQERSIPFTRDDVREMTREQIKSHRSQIGRLTASGDNVGDPLNHPLRSVGLDTYSFAIRSKAEELTGAYIQACEKLQETAGPMAEGCHMQPPETVDEYSRLAQVAQCAAEVRKASGTSLWLIHGDSNKIRAYLQEKEEIDRKKEQLLQRWKETFLDADMSAIIQRHEAASRKLLGRGSALKALAAEVQTMAKGSVAPEDIPAAAREVRAWQDKRKACEQLLDGLPPAERSIAKELQSLQELSDAAAKAETLRSSMEKCQAELAELQAATVQEEQMAAYMNAWNDWRDKSAELNILLKRKEQGNATIQAKKETTTYLRNHPSALKDWSIYVHDRDACLAAGLLPVVTAFEDGMPSGEVYPAYRKGIYYALINEIISTDEVLSTFSGSSFNESVRQFKQIDEALIQQTRTEIFNRLVDRIPSSLDSPAAGVELNLLRKAIGSNARGMSIRALFEKLSHIIQRLCPVMLMSPNSVAQYLERKNDLFDVVIFDEASQLPTCKAVGALARGKSAVIVGDPKQMPPTSFFAGNTQVTDDLSLADLDSILDDALALGIPSRYLQWHYRSTHESLIAFSNHEFYDNRMFTFPSANDRERHVTAVHVNGVYKRSVNAKEAEAVVEEIIRRYRDPELRKYSIGVVTFNVKQQDVIYNLLAKQFQKDPEMDAWANSGEDPLFIKNLENVQGDERDVILFSIGYGPDEKGNLSMNFGPINKAGGGKRLNVAFSRARVAMMIFTSMHSSQIKVTESSPDGLKAFQAFLHYAEGNNLGDNRRPTGDEEEEKDGILSRICAAIREQGFECQTNIGHSNFHVDIAVIDPFDSNQYLMGILLDGENYRISGNTRDREIGQAGVLNRLGWRLHRIWTIDWWDDSGKQLHILTEKLEEARKEAEVRAAEKQRNQQIVTPEPREKLEKELAAETEAIIAEDEQGEPEWLETQTAAKVPNRETDETEKTAQSPSEGLTESKTQANEKADQTAEKSEPVSEPKRPEEQKDDRENENFTGDYREVPYIITSLPETPISSDEYAAPGNRKEIARRIELIVQTEQPIHRDVLIWRLLVSFEIKRATTGLVETTDKAIKSAKVKAVKAKGNIFYWMKDVDPKEYRVFRIWERPIVEVSPHELRNAICYVLKQNGGRMDGVELLYAASRIMGYKRLGKNVEAAIRDAMQMAKKDGFICGEDQITLSDSEESLSDADSK